MAQMLGDSLLPESVQSKRRVLRNKLQQARQPIRERRQRVGNKLPGPNVVDMTESKLMELRTRVVQRDGVLEGIRNRGNGSDNSGGNSGNTGSSGSEDEML